MKVLLFLPVSVNITNKYNRYISVEEVDAIRNPVVLFADSVRSANLSLKRRRRRRFRIDTEIRCMGAHPPFWPFEPARIKRN